MTTDDQHDGDAYVSWEDLARAPWRDRLRAAWGVLRGRSVMFQCVLTYGYRKLYVASLPDGPGVTTAYNSMVTFFEGDGRTEVVVFDWDDGLTYPLRLDGRVPAARPDDTA